MYREYHVSYIRTTYNHITIIKIIAVYMLRKLDDEMLIQCKIEFELSPFIINFVNLVMNKMKEDEISCN